MDLSKIKKRRRNKNSFLNVLITDHVNTNISSDTAGQIFCLPHLTSRRGSTLQRPFSSLYCQDFGHCSGDVALRGQFKFWYGPVAQFVQRVIYYNIEKVAYQRQRTCVTYDKLKHFYMQFIW